MMRGGLKRLNYPLNRMSTNPRASASLVRVCVVDGHIDCILFNDIDGC